MIRNDLTKFICVIYSWLRTYFKKYLLNIECHAGSLTPVKPLYNNHLQVKTTLRKFTLSRVLTLSRLLTISGCSLRQGAHYIRVFITSHQDTGACSLHLIQGSYTYIQYSKCMTFYRV